MPFPVAHSLVGATLAEGLLTTQTAHRDSKIAFIACLTLLPDFDFLLVWVLDFDRSWHRGFTHSIAFALAFGFLMAALWGIRRVREVVACTLALMSHGLLDTLTTIDGQGVELLWPFSPARFKAEFFAPTELSLPTDNVGQVITYLLTISLIEAAVLVPAFLTVFAIRRRWLKPVHSE
jgi:membrane-bound metal-dependent hydrolase YbcI (DUF457 family)